ncbi:glutamate--tRNA ligase [Litorimonas cladophorae]|uniref:Glutamate--tRNA ligase n=1 Tax=Litorimonas cladophorae TaxID=1220491 RepID=A0A918NCI6_9PROT|nr:glutamate--tRNA ligase [Litorimonas cladophorae]GGX60123.1 glutamate--tRNA ligase [Litorimonas cladophorae]
MTKPIVRFAPSPTGRLHVGNVRTALMNVLFAQAEEGMFILRIDDTDVERSTAEYEQGIKDDLTWLGVSWGKTFKQSERFDMYDAAADKLRAAGLLYPCYETADELDRQRKLQRVAGKPPVYNRAALELTDDQKAAYEAEGRTPHWRFKLSGGTVTWTDMVRGEQSIDVSSLSDPVLIRGDGSYLYTLPSVVDDIEAEITHVIRGEDHVTNSAAQIEVFQALSTHLPTFAHTPLLVGADGKSLSKRLGSLSMLELRDQGIEPMAVASLLSKIGTSDAVEIRHSLQALASEFSFTKIGRAPARFDEKDLIALNAKLLHETPYAEVADRIPGDAAFWNIVRANIEKISDVEAWADIVLKPMAGEIAAEDVDFCKSAASFLPDTILPETWSELVGHLKTETGRKGKGLFMPLRLALTAQGHGPSMDDMLVLLGAEKAKARLSGDVA